LSQPAPHPHHVANLLEPVLGGIVTALSDRGQTDALYREKAAETWTVIQSFQPRDAIDLMLTGQLIAFNEVFADATRHLLRGMTESVRQRTQSGLVAMGRLTLAHVDKLEKRGIEPYRTEAAQEQRATPAAAAAPPEPPRAAAPAASPKAAPRPKAAAAPPPPPPPEPEPTPPAAPPPAEEKSWLEEPYQEWLLETPAMLAAQSDAVPQLEARAPANAANCGNGSVEDRTGAPPEPVFPYQEPSNSPAQTLVAAAAGD
jgi:hypothetical protein